MSRPVNSPGKSTSDVNTGFIADKPAAYLPCLFAVIVGIDEYEDPDVPNLRGAVADANAVKEFLESTFPNRSIVTLRNSEATRTAIVNTITELSMNVKIKKDNPILIYYAGHGSKAPAPSGIETNDANNMITMILPYDFSFKGSISPQGQGIWNLQLSKLLQSIATAKSDNITAIFDSCYSGAGLRVENLTARHVRLPPDYTIPTDLFETETRNRFASVNKSDEKFGLMSHVLMAACKQSQYAYETNEGDTAHGLFTVALLSVLTKAINKVTYREVIEGLTLDYQHPQCEGVNQNCIIFTKKGTGHSPNTYRIRSVTELGNQVYIVKAGTALGVTKGATFSVYTNPSDTTTYIGSAQATGIVSHDEARCDFHGTKSTAPFPDDAYAVLNMSEHVLIQVDDTILRCGLESVLSDNANFRLISTADLVSPPDLLLTMSGTQVHFEIMLEACRKNNMTRMPHEIEVNNNNSDQLSKLSLILSRAANFYWQLHRSNGGRVSLSEGSITLECFKLEQGPITIDPYGFPYVPWLPKSPNLNVDGTINVTVNDDDKYGFRINNRTKVSLYAALFCFDVGDLRIDTYYIPPTAAEGQFEFSIPAETSLLIGYGDSGFPARQFYLRENQVVDIGFLKLYISTNYVDFSSIAQQSPFENNSPQRIGLHVPSRVYVPFWDTFTFPIIQRAAEVS